MNDSFYGKVTENYFRNAIAYVKERNSDVNFFFFSDEMDWVEQNLLDYCGGACFEMVKGNKAYEDLSLMALCDIFVSSQGSAGKVAAMINGKGLLIISDDPHDRVWKERYDNVMVIGN